MNEIEIFFNDPLNPKFGAVARVLFKGYESIRVEVDWAGSERDTLKAAGRTLFVAMGEE